MPFASVNEEVGPCPSGCGGGRAVPQDEPAFGIHCSLNGRSMGVVGMDESIDDAVESEWFDTERKRPGQQDVLAEGRHAVHEDAPV